MIQILLLDSQREDVPGFTGNPDTEDRSYLFLLQPLERGLSESKEDMVTVRVTLSEIVTGLTAHHILLQIIGSILLQGTRHLVPSLANLVLTSPAATPRDSSGTGLGSKLTVKQLIILLVTLKQSHTAAVALDSRPGLKFLLQKVAQIPHAANLYKQAGAAWSIRGVTLFDICLSNIRNKGVTADGVQLVLEDHVRNKNTFGTDSNADDSKEEDESSLFFCDLHDAFLDICETYIDIIVDKEGQRERVDKISQQQIFFFSVEPDSLEDFIGKLREQPPIGERESIEGQSDQEGAPAKVSSAVSDNSDDELSEKNEETTVVNKEDMCDEDEENSSSNCEENKEQSLAEENMKIQEAEDIIESQSNQQVDESLSEENHTKVEKEISPFQFSDFTRQPNRPDSPNINEESDNELDISSHNINQIAELEIENYGSVKESDDERKSLDMENLPPRTQGDGKEKEDLVSMAAKQKVINDYKVSKSMKSMPPKSTRKNPFIIKQQTSMSKHPVDPEIEEQRSSSLLKDSEAQIAVWNELVVLILDLVARLNDHEFKVMYLPSFPLFKWNYINPIRM